MTTYNVHFGHRDDCVVWAPASDKWEVSVLRRGSDGHWHCPLCGATDCRHAEAAEKAVQDEALNGAENERRSNRQGNAPAPAAPGAGARSPIQS